MDISTSIIIFLNMSKEYFDIIYASSGYYNDEDLLNDDKLSFYGKSLEDGILISSYNEKIDIYSKHNQNIFLMWREICGLR